MFGERRPAAKLRPGVALSWPAARYPVCRHCPERVRPVTIRRPAKSGETDWWGWAHVESGKISCSEWRRHDPLDWTPAYAEPEPVPTAVDRVPAAQPRYRKLLTH